MEINLSLRYADVIEYLRPDQLLSEEKRPSGACYPCRNGIQLELTFLRSSVLRVSYRLPHFPNHFPSYTPDPDLEVDRVKIEHTETHDAYLLQTESLQVRIDRRTGRLRMETPEGELIQEDKQGFTAVRSVNRGVTRVQLEKRIQPSEEFYGLGDKSGRLQLRGQRLENWNTDAFAFGEKTDPLYRSIPFFFGYQDGRGYGLFLDNTYRSTFDFGRQLENNLQIAASGGEMVYYFFYGPELIRVAELYAWLSGRPPLPPLWALGYHQCRWSYFPESRVREVAETFRRERIPCDAIYLDIDYMDGYRCFTWDQDRFPDPAGLVGELHEQGFHTVVMIDPGIKAEPGYEVFDEGVEKEVFCRRPDGSYMVGSVWPGPCVFPDFTREAVRQWWGRLYRQLYVETKISGFWNDMNEPAVFRLNRLTFPDEVLHDFEGRITHHARVHNVYGMQMARATVEGLEKLKPDKRPFLLTRATFAGGQRYAALWTGDNIASWEHLAIGNRQCQRLSISGFSFCGTDVGGFVDRPGGELFTRWIQLGAFHPLFRVHSMGNHASGAEEVKEEEVTLAEARDRLDQEPWSFGEPYTGHVRRAIELRYRLLPYLYTAFREYVRNGRPVLLPLSFYDPSDSTCRKREREFLFGPDLLVSPVLIPGRREQAVYFPAGSWYDFHSGLRRAGPGFQRVPAPLEHIPLYVRAGAVLPLHPVRQHSSEPVEELLLRVFYAEGEQLSRWYEDAGEGAAYRKGAYRENELQATGYPRALELSWQSKGAWKPGYRRVRLRFTGLPFPARKLRIDGQAVALKSEGDSPEAVWEGDSFSRCLLE